MGLLITSCLELIQKQIKKAEKTVAEAESELLALMAAMKLTISEMGHSLTGILKAAETFGSELRRAEEINQDLKDALTRMSGLVAAYDGLICSNTVKNITQSKYGNHLDIFQADEEQAKRELQKTKDAKAKAQAKPDQSNLVEQAQQAFDLLMHILQKMAESRFNSQSLNDPSKKGQGLSGSLDHPGSLGLHLVKDAAERRNLDNQAV